MGEAVADAAERIVVLGGGHAGAAVCAFLRQFGWPGEILLLCGEPIAPYHRPPLSKAWLKGEASAESLALRAASFWEEQRITLRLGARAVVLDAAAQALRLASGEVVPYDHLILATGARARRPPIPGAEDPRLRVLREAADAEALAGQLGAGRRLLIVGGGWIGLEVAASARALGTEVLLLEREPRLLARVASEALAERLAARHLAAGVALLNRCAIAAVAQDGVTLNDGTRLGADVVLLACGAAPEASLARAAGLAEPQGGIAVDAAGRTRDAHIRAIGDVTLRPLPGGGTGRLESVPSATEQARACAADLCGKPLPAPETPWFWSDQYELRVQIAGLLPPAAHRIARGASLFHLDAAGRLACVESVSDAPGFMAGKRLIAAGRTLDPARLADPATPLTAVAA
jgi:3-phenylpropionate/trans-cinnamate dioxygenase ferredoxin reductase subunit